ncbi:hypothetical protein OHB24_11780 [Kribbella sp. NBC_00482]
MALVAGATQLPASVVTERTPRPAYTIWFRSCQCGSMPPPAWIGR